jgi:GT2 family glycosyltransferase
MRVARHTGKLNIAVGIATSGRPEILREIVGLIEKQTRQPDTIFVCPAKPEDAGDLASSQPSLKIVHGPAGLPHQRNVILDHCAADVVLFIDDDFLMRSDYVAELETLFLSNPEVVLATGVVIADGIRGPGYSFDEGVAFLNEPSAKPDWELRSTYGGYGCNMAMRMLPIRAHRLRFDENLPLYAWLEDIDFSRQLARFGQIVKVSSLRGVHLGTKRSGRTSGVRLGYSQIVNPVYLAKKGTISWAFAAKYIRRQMLANVVRSGRPEPWVDRRGRLKGNLIGIWEIIAGRAKPSRIMALS